jgi:hypothetical protein
MNPFSLLPPSVLFFSKSTPPPLASVLTVEAKYITTSFNTHRKCSGWLSPESKDVLLTTVCKSELSPTCPNGSRYVYAPVLPVSYPGSSPLHPSFPLQIHPEVPLHIDATDFLFYSLNPPNFSNTAADGHDLEPHHSFLQ